MRECRRVRVGVDGSDALGGTVSFVTKTPVLGDTKPEFHGEFDTSFNSSDLGFDLALTGFPDSHFTDYARAVDLPKHVLLWLQAGFAILFVVLAIVPIGVRARTLAGLAAAVALGLTAALHWIGVPWYYGTHLGLDNGIGG